MAFKKKAEEKIIDAKEEKPVMAMATQEVDIVVPNVSPEQAIQAFRSYQQMCEGLLDASDYQVISMYQQGKGMVKRPFKKKTAWRKLATAYNLSDSILKEERKEYLVGTPKQYFVIEVTAECKAKNGRVTTGTGSCASNERGFAHLEHDVRSTAHTRAKNRAISDMIGAGEVSAEEIEQAENRKNESCSVDHTKLVPIASKKENKNKGKMYVRCDRCGYWRWLDSPTAGTPIDVASPVSSNEPSAQEPSPVDGEEQEPDPADLF